MREITKEQWIKMLALNCDRGKHRIRMNRYGVSWCIICGRLSSTNNVDDLKENESLLIK